MKKRPSLKDAKLHQQRNHLEDQSERRLRRLKKVLQALIGWNDFRLLTIALFTLLAKKPKDSEEEEEDAEEEGDDEPGDALEESIKA